LRVLEGHIVGSHDGFVKIVADAKYGEILASSSAASHRTHRRSRSRLGLKAQSRHDVHHPRHPTGRVMLDAYGAVEGMAINA